MGLDPVDPDYECGGGCLNCWPIPFDGCAPKYVWANISGMAACPGWLGFVPNGTYKLTKKPVGPCVWNATYNQFLFQWNCTGPSAFSISQVVPPFRDLFLANNVAKCITEFDNEGNCGAPPFTVTSGGHCTITWGPEDPCP